MRVAREAHVLRQSGADVVDFGPGEPDFDTPVPVREAAVAALRSGVTHYAPSAGYPDLRAAVSEKLERENALTYDPESEIIVTPGAKQALVEGVLSTVGPGDEVIVFEPCWGSYAAIAHLAGGLPVPVRLNEDFTINPERFAAALSSATRAVILGSPSNPTGHVLNREELELVARAARERDLVVISDEIYERITYPGVTAVSIATLPGMWERTITVNGFSKAYAMTGWRLGYAAAPREIVQAMLKVQEQTVTAVTSFAQMGAIEALRGSQEPIREMVSAFARRRSLIVEGLNAIPGIRVHPPEGAFYVFPDISGTGLTGTEFARLLLAHLVAVTPGVGFGAGCDQHVRLSFAVSEERIASGLARMAGALAGK